MNLVETMAACDHTWENLAVKNGQLIQVRKHCPLCSAFGDVLWRGTPTEFRKLTAPDAEAFTAAQAKRERKAAKVRALL